MMRVLLQSTAFVRAARRLVKKYPEVGPTLEATFAALMEDAFPQWHIAMTLQFSFSNGPFSLDVGFACFQ